MTKPTPLEKLILKLEGKLPEDLLEEVSDFLYEQDMELKELKEEAQDLQKELDELDEKEEVPLNELQVARAFNSLTDKEKQSCLGEIVDTWDSEYELHLFYGKKYPEMVFQDGTYYIKYPDWQLGANPYQHDQLEEYINQHGVEETLSQLTSVPQYT